MISFTTTIKDSFIQKRMVQSLVAAKSAGEVEVLLHRFGPYGGAAGFPDLSFMKKNSEGFTFKYEEQEGSLGLDEIEEKSPWFIGIKSKPMVFEVLLKNGLNKHLTGQEAFTRSFGQPVDPYNRGWYLKDLHPVKLALYYQNPESTELALNYGIASSTGGPVGEGSFFIEHVVEMLHKAGDGFPFKSEHWNTLKVVCDFLSSKKGAEGALASQKDLGTLLELYMARCFTKYTNYSFSVKKEALNNPLGAVCSLIDYVARSPFEDILKNAITQRPVVFLREPEVFLNLLSDSSNAASGYLKKNPVVLDFLLNLTQAYLGKEEGRLVNAGWDTPVVSQWSSTPSRWTRI